MVADGDKNKSYSYTIEKIEGYFDFFSRESSKVLRGLILLGYGIVWIFKDILIPTISSAEDTNIILAFNPKHLLTALIFLTFSLIFDLSQYVIGGVKWLAKLIEGEKMGLNRGDTIKIKVNYVRILTYIFFLKLTLAIVGYVFIFIVMFKVLFT
jgi:hypothetical protein